MAKKNKIFVFHHPLRSLLLNPKDSKVLLLPGNNYGRQELDFDAELIKNVYSKYFPPINRMVYYEENIDKLISEAAVQETSIEPFDFFNSEKVVELLDATGSRLFGSQQDPELTISAIKKVETKRAIYSLLNENLPQYINRKFVIANYEELERSMLDSLRKFGKIIVKLDGSAAGLCSSVITSEEDINTYLNELDSGILNKFGLRLNSACFIIEEFFPHWSNTSFLFYIKDDSIELMCYYDPIIENGTKYAGFKAPSESSNIVNLTSAGKEICNLLRKLNIRGPVNIDFMESENNFAVAEINLRYSSSFYPFMRKFSPENKISYKTVHLQSVRDDLIDRLEKMKRAGTLYDSKKNTGIFPIIVWWEDGTKRLQEIEIRQWPKKTTR